MFRIEKTSQLGIKNQAIFSFSLDTTVWTKSWTSNNCQPSDFSLALSSKILKNSYYLTEFGSGARIGGPALPHKLSYFFRAVRWYCWSCILFKIWHKASKCIKPDALNHHSYGGYCTLYSPGTLLDKEIHHAVTFPGTMATSQRPTCTHVNSPSTYSMKRYITPYHFNNP